MGEYTATAVWPRAAITVFTDHRASRVHRWMFDGGAVVPASSASVVVPLLRSDAMAVAPEEALVASPASGHKVLSLSVTARTGCTVEQYQDRAVGVMPRTAEGRQALIQGTQNPVVSFAVSAPDRQQQRAWQHDTHEQCFIAASVRCAVSIEPAV